MHPELQHPYESMEKQKADALARLEALSDAERARQPTPTEWSPLQVMEHVVLVEEWLASEDSPLPEGARVLPKGCLFIVFASNVMRSGLRIPTLRAAEPKGELHYEAIRSRWEAARQNLRVKAESATPHTLSRPAALHPVAGPLSIHQSLRLLDAHLCYHLRFWPRVENSSSSASV